MAFHNELRAEKAIWRPYLDSDDEFTSNQHSIDNREICLETATLRPYYELEDGDRRLLKQRSVESYEREARYVDFDWINYVNTRRNFQFTKSCPQTIGNPIWHERHKQTYWENSSWDNCANSTQKQNEYNINAFVDITNRPNVNSLTNVDCIENGLKSKIYGQTRLENDQMSMDKEILKAYYERETCYNASVWQKQSEYNPEKERTDALIHPTQNVHSATEINIIENGIKVTQVGQIGLEDTKFSMDKDVLKTYYESEKGKDSCVPNIGEENHSTHAGIGMPNMVNTVIDGANIQNDLHSINNGQWYMEDIFRLISSYNQTQHVKKHSRDQSKTKLQCKYCNKYITGKHNLRMHIRTIHEDPFHRPYRCSKCDATCKTKSCLKKHMKSHERIPTFKYTCSECKTGFNNATKFRAHMRMNRMNMPDLKCDICNMTFKYKGCYELHQKEHVVEDSCITRQDNNQRANEESIHKDTTVSAHSRIITDDRVSNSLDNPKVVVHSNENKEALLEKTHRESIEDSTDTSSITIQNDAGLKSGTVINMIGGIGTIDDSLDIKQDEVIMIKNIDCKPNIGSEGNVLVTEYEEQHVHTDVDLAGKAGLNTHLTRMEGYQHSFMEGETVFVNGYIGLDRDKAKHALAKDVQTAKQKTDTEIDPIDDAYKRNMNPRDDCLMSKAERAVCTNEHRDQEVGDDNVQDSFDKLTTLSDSDNHSFGGIEHATEDTDNRFGHALNTDYKTMELFENTTKSPRKVFKCDICAKTLSSKSSLHRHKVVHTGQKDYSCDTCGKSFTLKDTLKNHIVQHIGDGPYKCGQCGKSFSAIARLKSHCLLHSTLRPYKCGSCNRTFKCKEHLGVHIKFVHASVKPFKCGVCDARFVQKRHYISHCKIHTGDGEREQCHYCNKFYVGKYYLNVHIGAVHERPHERPHHCEKCGASFKTRSTLQIHMKSHERKTIRERQPDTKLTFKYSCAYCNASFKTSEYLRLHMNIHKTGLYYKCDNCNIAFKFHRCFIMHKKEHAV